MEKKPVRKPIPEYDPKTKAQRIVRSYFGYELICDQCHIKFIFYKNKRVRNFTIKHGWHTAAFCSSRCRDEYRARMNSFIGEK